MYEVIEKVLGFCESERGGVMLCGRGLIEYILIVVDYDCDKGLDGL